MEYKEFEKLILAYKKFHEDSSELYRLGINLFDGHFNLEEQCSEILDTSLHGIFTEEGVDWINWFMFENDFGEKGLKAYDEDGNEICYDLPSLWEYIKQYEK